MKKLTPVKAIRRESLDCCCGRPLEVRLCTCVTCAYTAIEWVIGLKVNNYQDTVNRKNPRVAYLFFAIEKEITT